MKPTLGFAALWMRHFPLVASECIERECGILDMSYKTPCDEYLTGSGIILFARQLLHICL